MKSWWYYYDKGLHHSEVQYIKDYAKTLKPMVGTVGHGGSSVVNKNMRNSHVKWMTKDPSIQWLFDRISLFALRANKECFNFQLPNEPFLNFDAFQFTQYHSKQQQHYDWHTDNNWITQNQSSWDRKLSVVVQLTEVDKYEGGILQLDGVVIPADKFRNPGDIVIFPSFLKHRVTPVTKGARQSLVTWITGPRFC